MFCSQNRRRHINDRILEQTPGRAFWGRIWKGLWNHYASELNGLQRLVSWLPFPITDEEPEAQDKNDWRPLDLTVSEGHSVWRHSVWGHLHFGSKRHPENGTNQMGRGQYRRHGWIFKTHFTIIPTAIPALVYLSTLPMEFKIRPLVFRGKSEGLCWCHVSIHLQWN